MSRNIRGCTPDASKKLRRSIRGCTPDASIKEVKIRLMLYPARLKYSTIQPAQCPARSVNYVKEHVGTFLELMERDALTPGPSPTGKEEDEGGMALPEFPGEFFDLNVCFAGF